MVCRLQIDTWRNIGRALMLTIPGHCLRLTVILHLSRSCTTGTKPASTKQKSVMMTMFMLKGHSWPSLHALSFCYHFHDFYDTGAKPELNAASEMFSAGWTDYRHVFALQLWQMDPSQALTGSSSFISIGELLMTRGLNTQWLGPCILLR